MRKEEIDRIARQRPFRPFEVRLVDGRTYRFNGLEDFLLTRSAIHTVDKLGRPEIIDLLMIATAHELKVEGA